MKQAILERLKELGGNISLSDPNPDYTNTERALRLNKAGDIAVWLKEAAEPLLDSEN